MIVNNQRQTQWKLDQAFIRIGIVWDRTHLSIKCESLVFYSIEWTLWHLRRFSAWCCINVYSDLDYYINDTDINSHQTSLNTLKWNFVSGCFISKIRKQSGAYLRKIKPQSVNLTCYDSSPSQIVCRWYRTPNRYSTFNFIYYLIPLYNWIITCNFQIGNIQQLSMSL